MLTVRTEVEMVNVAETDKHPNSPVPGSARYRITYLGTETLGPLFWVFRFSAASKTVRAELYLRDTVVSQCEFQVEVDAPQARRLSEVSMESADD